MFVDQAVIQVSGGKGGDGVVSFRRAKYESMGGPNGGDGGNGGSVWLEAVPGLDTLLDMAGRHHWDAEDGQPGQSTQCHGRKGADLEVRLPPGTVVYDDETGQVIQDMDSPGKRFRVAQGGRGGWGNEHFKSSTDQAPRRATPGDPGQALRLRLELKLIADVGIIGKPNAGKSTLLARVSRARPKIANYPFTTLCPQLGIAELPGARRLVLADIPGLIEGASHGAGLGHEFLRHIERTRILIHLVEAVTCDGSTVQENYLTVRRELEAHSEALAGKSEILVLSKLDLVAPDEQSASLERIGQALGLPVLGLSAISGQGSRELLEECWKRLNKN